MNCYHPTEKRQWLDSFPGGMMFYLGCHLIDLIYSIHGEPENIVPFNRPTSIDGVTADDIGFAVLEYNNGISFAKTSAIEHGGFLRRQLVVCGSKGTYEIKPFERSLGYTQYTGYSETYCDAEGNSSWNQKGDYRTSENHDRYIAMFESFASYVRGEKENPCSYEYEKQLHKIVLRACGVDIDYKRK